MSTAQLLLLALVLAPVLAAAVGLPVGRRHRGAAAGIAVTGGIVSLAAALGLAGSCWSQACEPVTLGRLDVGSQTLTLGYDLDPTTSLVVVAVAVVALCVQVYSVGYLVPHHGDTGPLRYAPYAATVSLFSAAMLLVVGAQDLLLMLVGWEVMGFASYLLIGHHSERPAARRAALQAFLVTRLADVGFIVAVLAAYQAVGTTNIPALLSALEPGQAAPGPNPVAVTVAALGLVIAVAGKSAQFPLQGWLPDAMEGPTPVSALIHAATMVAAGVVVLFRLGALLSAAPVAMSLLGVIACVSMLAAGLAALCADDLKRVLAWSTVSQIAVMLAALALGGTAGPVAAIMLMLAHAAFKALLFLTAGAISVRFGTTKLAGLADLRRREPRLTVLLGIGLAGLAALPPLAGFVGKEGVLTAAHHAYSDGESLLPGWLALAVLVSLGLTTLLTATYSGRLFGALTRLDLTKPVGLAPARQAVPGASSGGPHAQDAVAVAPAGGAAAQAALADSAGAVAQDGPGEPVRYLADDSIEAQQPTDNAQSSSPAPPASPSPPTRSAGTIGQAETGDGTDTDAPGHTETLGGQGSAALPGGADRATVGPIDAPAGASVGPVDVESDSGTGDSAERRGPQFAPPPAPAADSTPDETLTFVDSHGDVQDWDLIAHLDTARPPRWSAEGRAKREYERQEARRRVESGHEDAHSRRLAGRRWRREHDAAEHEQQQEPGAAGQGVARPGAVRPPMAQPATPSEGSPQPGQSQPDPRNQPTEALGHDRPQTWTTRPLDASRPHSRLVSRVSDPSPDQSPDPAAGQSRDNTPTGSAPGHRTDRLDSPAADRPGAGAAAGTQSGPATSQERPGPRGLPNRLARAVAGQRRLPEPGAGTPDDGAATGRAEYAAPGSTQPIGDRGAPAPGAGSSPATGLPATGSGSPPATGSPTTGSAGSPVRLSAGAAQPAPAPGAVPSGTPHSATPHSATPQSATSRPAPTRAERPPKPPVPPLPPPAPVPGPAVGGSILGPLVLLAVLTVAGGALAFVAPGLQGYQIGWLTSLVGIVLAVAGVAIGLLRGPAGHRDVATRLPDGLRAVAAGGFGYQRVQQVVVVRPVRALARLIALGDEAVIGTWVSAPSLLAGLGRQLVRFQSGRISDYLAWVGAAAVLVGILVLTLAGAMR
ncbi:MAG: proton-conducting transporter membrane subunit [Actinomycetales bacterium]